MNNDLTLARNELFSSMDSGKPHAAYIKTILGQVAVTVWDNFLDKPVDVILKGDPRRNDSGCIVAVYSERENAFFKRANLRHFKNNTLKPIEIKQTDTEEIVKQISDEELTKVVNSRYLALLAELNKITSVPVLFRMLTIAEELEKSEKITGAIQKRISELQSVAFPSSMEIEGTVTEAEE